MSFSSKQLRHLRTRNEDDTIEEGDLEWCGRGCGAYRNWHLVKPNTDPHFEPSPWYTGVNHNKTRTPLCYVSS